MNIEARDGMHSNKKMIMKIAAFFIGGMLLLTFFPKTLNNIMLPEITAETPISGVLIKRIEGDGVVEAKKYATFYAPAGIEVLDVMVKEGAFVRKGQALMKLDVSRLENELEDEKAGLRQKRLALEALMDRNYLLTYDLAVSCAQLDLDNAAKALEKAAAKLKETTDLYLNTLKTKEDIEAARLDEDNAKLTYERAKMGLSSAKAARSKAIDDNKSNIDATQYDIEAAMKKIEELKSNVGLGTVTAQSDGIVGVLNAVQGELTDSAKPLYKLVELSQGFRFVFTTDAKNAGILKPGDTGDVMISALGSIPVQGTVVEVADNQQRKGEKKDVYMDIPSEGLTGGETGYAEISRNTDSYEILVSNSAIGQDNAGDFVYILKSRKSPLGNEYYVRKADVTIADNDDARSAVISGISGSDMIVNGSDRQISDGMRVRLDDKEVEN